MAFLFFRTDDRQNKATGNHEEVGELVGFLPDDHLAKGGDFGRKGRREFVWIRVTDCPDEDMLRGLMADDPGRAGKLRRFHLHAATLRAQPGVSVAWHTKAFVRGVDVTEAECPTIPWAALVVSMRDRETGKPPHEKRLVEHYGQRQVDEVDKLIADEQAAGRSATMDLLAARTAARQKRDAAKSDADRGAVSVPGRAVRP